MTASVRGTDEESAKAFAAGRHVFSLVRVIGSVAFLLLLVFGFEPYFRPYVVDTTFSEAARSADPVPKDARSAVYLIHDGLLVRVTGFIFRDGERTYQSDLNVEIKWGVFIALSLGFMLFLVLVAYWKHSVTLDDGEQLPRPANYEDGVVDEFVRVSATVRRDADQQFLQARLMLVSGIVVAVTGVIVFATFLDSGRYRPDRFNLSMENALKSLQLQRATEAPPLVARKSNGPAMISEQEWLESIAASDRIDDKKLTAILNHREKMAQSTKLASEPESASQALANLLPAARSFALFLAIEAIAWFLLRQYRFAIADFKQIYRMYLRRESLFLAWKVGQSQGAKESGVPVAVLAALLQEGHLAKSADESTPDLKEKEATDENNPFSDLYKTVIENWRSK